MAHGANLVAPSLLGVMAGARSQSVLAFIAWHGLDRRAASPLGRSVTTLAALGEAVGDKTSWVPDRTAPGPLFGRIAFGALGGVAVARFEGSRPLCAAIVGGASAAVSTFALHRARRWLGRHTPLPGLAWALVEDGCVALLGVAASRRLSRHQSEG